MVRKLIEQGGWDQNSSIDTKEAKLGLVTLHPNPAQLYVLLIEQNKPICYSVQLYFGLDIWTQPCAETKVLLSLVGGGGEFLHKLFIYVMLGLYTKFQYPTMPGTGQKVCGGMVGGM